jgi:hypothetical protein
MVTTAQHISMQVYAEKVRLNKLGLERVSSSKKPRGGTNPLLLIYDR